MLDHPLLGDYALGKFGAVGSAICHNGARPPTQDGRISICAPLRRELAGLTIEDAPPEGHAHRRFTFEIPLQQIERILPIQEGCNKAQHFVRGEHIGRVDHVLGRGGEDYIGRGATDQMIADCMLLISANSAGLIFDFTGSLSDRGWLAPVELSLKQKAYEVRFHMPWQVSRYFFSPNTLHLLYGKFASTAGGN